MNTENLLPTVPNRTIRESSSHRSHYILASECQKSTLATQVLSGDPAEAKAAMEALQQRLLTAIPPGTFYLESLLKIASFEWSDKIPSAAITCETMPTLLFNPEFVERHCILDTDLRMVVLHELHHILYGHHILCGAIDIARNVAFDAVINARLCKVWEEPAHADFFRHVYRDAGFPALLLYPPPGWPNGTDEQNRAGERLRLLRQVDMKTAGRVLRLRTRLYEPGCEVGFDEVLDLLRQHSLNMPLLLGNHTPSAAAPTDNNAVAYPFVLETARKMHGFLGEQEQRDICGRKRASAGGPLFGIRVTTANPRAAFLCALKRVLLKAGIYRQHLSARRRREILPADRETLSVIPNWRDRTAAARNELFGTPPLLYRHRMPGRAPGWKPVRAAHVYLDVSGSMWESLPWITAALRSLEKNGLCRIFLFSTCVTPLPKGLAGAGPLPTTGGTDIQPVLEHLLAIPARQRPAQAVVITDGFFRLHHLSVSQLIKRFEASNIALHAAVTYAGSTMALSKIAASVTQLPSHK